MILHERFDAEEVLKTIEREKVTPCIGNKAVQHQLAPLPGDHGRQSESGSAGSIEEKYYT